MSQGQDACSKHMMVLLLAPLWNGLIISTANFEASISQANVNDRPPSPFLPPLELQKSGASNKYAFRKP